MNKGTKGTKGTKIDEGQIGVFVNILLREAREILLDLTAPRKLGD
jgi:hypothetical protein